MQRFFIKKVKLYLTFSDTVFATGGGDGYVNFWDIKLKKRIKQFGKYPSSISSIDIAPNGNIMAIASSYCFEEGEKEYFHLLIVFSHAPDSIFLKELESFI